MEHQGYVYKWTNNETGMMYIGSTNGKNPYYIGSGKAFRKDYDQNPDNWEREIIYRGKDIRTVEREWIIKESAVDSSLYYNNTTTTFAAMDGKTHSIETRKKMSETSKNMSAETRKKLSEAAKGKPKSDEHRAKMSEVSKNRSDEHRAAISAAQLGKKRGPYKKRKMQNDN